MRVKQENPREFESIRELSAKTGMCYRTIHRAVKAGKIRAVRFGGSLLIHRDEIARILQRGF